MGIGDNDPAYDERSPLVTSARNSLDRRSIEGRATSFTSSRDLQDDVDPLVSYECARRTVQELTNHTALVDERLRRGTITDDFDYNERRDSEEADTLSLSDAHPSRDGIDEPEAIGDQLLSPQKDGKSDDRVASPFDIVPLWQRLKRVDELDVAGPSRTSLINENAKPRGTARKLEATPKSTALSDASSDEISVGNSTDDVDESEPVEPRGKRARRAAPGEEVGGLMIAVHESALSDSGENADAESDADLTEATSNLIRPAPSAIDQGSSSDPWSTADPASDVEALLHARASLNAAQPDGTAIDNSAVGADGAESEAHVHRGGVAGAVLDKVMDEVVGVMDKTREDAVNTCSRNVHEFTVISASTDDGGSTTSETGCGIEDVNNDAVGLAQEDADDHAYGDADDFVDEDVDIFVAKVVEDDTGGSVDSECNAVINGKGNHTSEAGEESDASGEVFGESFCRIANEAVISSSNGDSTSGGLIEDEPDDVTDEDHGEAAKAVISEVADSVAVDTAERSSEYSGLPVDHARPENKLLPVCDRRVVQIHEDHLNNRLASATSGAVVNSSHRLTPTDGDGDDVLSSLSHQDSVEVGNPPPSFNDRKVAGIYEGSPATGNTSTEIQDNPPRSADSLLEKARNLEEQLKSVAQDTSAKLLGDDTSDVSICHGNELSQATITETNGSASARFSARLRGEELPRDIGFGLDLDPLCLSRDDYPGAARTPAMSPLAGVYYGDFSPPKAREAYPEGGKAEMNGLADYPEYGVLSGHGTGDSVFESDVNTPIMQATTGCTGPFNELELGAQFRNEAAPRRQVNYDDRRPPQAVPEVLLHDWSGSMPVEPNIEIVDSAPNSRSSATGLPSSSPRAIAPQEDIRHAALLLSARLNFDMSKPNLTRVSGEGHGPLCAERSSTKTKLNEAPSGLTTGSSTATRSPNRISLTQGGTKPKGSPKNHSVSSDSKRTKKDISFSTSMSHPERKRSSASGRESKSGRYFASISDAEPVELTDPKLRDFQMAVERKSVSEMGYRTAGLQNQDRSFLEMDRGREPVSDFRTYAENPDKHNMNHQRYSSQQRRRVSNMELNAIPREEGAFNPFRNVVERLVSRMQLGKKAIPLN